MGHGNLESSCTIRKKAGQLGACCEHLYIYLYIHSACVINRRRWKSVHSQRSLTSLKLQRDGGTVLTTAKLQWVGPGRLGGTGREAECGAALSKEQLKCGEPLNRRRKGLFECRGQDRGEANKKDHCGGKLLQTTQSGRGGK